MYTMKKYVELECTNEDCVHYQTSWEVYCRFETDGDGGYDLIPVSDDPTGYLGSLKCDCGEYGEEF